ncbi:MAG: type II toxin-antitoxin system VapB family antitoxin [Solirubrobacterales bacterium]|nr:type II toxin-antitoxin system VapB family antitoxin [Solirubrobacterales bacterium]
MAFNIKNDETHALVRELADKTGTTLAGAVDDAVREKLARENRRGLADRLLEIGREASQYQPESWRGRDTNEIIDDLLYDERGMPK